MWIIDIRSAPIKTVPAPLAPQQVKMAKRENSPLTVISSRRSVMLVSKGWGGDFAGEDDRRARGIDPRITMYYTMTQWGERKAVWSAGMNLTAVGSDRSPARKAREPIRCPSSSLLFESPFDSIRQKHMMLFPESIESELAIESFHPGCDFNCILSTCLMRV